jgi:hypothetical protein
VLSKQRVQIGDGELHLTLVHHLEGLVAAAGGDDLDRQAFCREQSLVDAPQNG